MSRLALGHGLFSLALVTLVAPPARADDEARSLKTEEKKHKDDASLAIQLPNFIGLSGMRDMIDARVPDGLLTIRGGVRFQEAKEDLHGHFLEFDHDVIDLQAYVGAAAFELLEAGARIPFEIDRTRDDRLGINGGRTRTTKDHFGSIDVGAKVGFDLGPLSLGPYAVGNLPSGDRRFSEKHGGAIGGAGTVSVYESRLNIFVNVDYGWYEGGLEKIDYRFGLAFVPLANKVLLLRPYVYLSGVRVVQDNPGNELRAAAGVQAMLLDFITLELGGDYRFVDDRTPQGLPDDRGTWTIDVAAGVAF